MDQGTPVFKSSTKQLDFCRCRGNVDICGVLAVSLKLGGRYFIFILNDKIIQCSSLSFYGRKTNEF